MDNNQTQHFSVVREELDVHVILERVYEALQEKGYNPVNQMVGYIMSGDPTYIYQPQECQKPDYEGRA